ncbi:MAG: acetyl-CoA carboxylase carboxyltransferase subunit alpha [Planctomycetota bacterium]|nr:acetyl-CoA carboxylase carboxyltransferase subunit alpha [Planctomycetota bacterium]
MTDTRAKSVSGPPVASGNGSLEFERPLARIEHELGKIEALQVESPRDLSAEIKNLRTSLRNMTRQTYSRLSAWETVQVARHPHRPILPDYLRLLARDYVELHGDRTCGDDRAIMTGFARIGGHKVMLIGQNKGKDTKEKIACNFGCAHPEGYRKALAKMKLAEKYGLPVVCLIDTQGAYPGIGSEERGIAQAIAMNLMEMSRLRVPIVCVVIGEGGSGGALGLAVGDRVAMLQYSFYSVISPEGCAAILFKTGDQARRAAELLHLTAKDLKKLDLIDNIISEPMGGAHRHPEAAVQNVETYISQTLREIKRVRIETLLKRRYTRLRELGRFFETDAGTGKNRPPSRRKTRAAGCSARAAGADRTLGQRSIASKTRSRAATV